ncbi:MAG TPA: LysE family transporter [Candidatus Sulfotelmatobacter sp.]|nr:LysE family transporter [Candidatus Sulfotelmatobacter sp.]
MILPLGPQNTFVLSQGFSQPNLLRALPVVVTAACCDTLLILLAVAGVSAVVGAIEWLRLVLVCGGVAFLVAAGWLTWKSAPPSPQSGDERTPAPMGKQVAFALACSLGNPHAIVDTIGVIGTSGLAYQGARLAAFTSACIAVSWSWFFGLALAGRILSRLELARRLLNPASALVMWASAGYLALSLVK